MFIVMRGSANLSTGVPGLDDVFQGLRDGDNVVWQVDDVRQYCPVVNAFAAESVRRGRRVVYFRFAKHKPQLQEGEGLRVVHLQPAHGFEVFVSQIHEAVVSGGRETVCVFDCLSELAADWCSDRMLGNFYMLICPYVYDHCGAAYFALLRNRHSFHATDPVRRTTQILVDLYDHDNRSYLHPQKVQYRHTRTMFSLHVQNDAGFAPVTVSAEIAEVLADRRWNRLDSESWRQGYWSDLFARAEDTAAALHRGEDPGENVNELARQLCRMLIARSGPMLALAETYLDLTSLLAIRRRMIGTGLVGGKSAGLVLAREVLRRASATWDTALETPDSFFIGADVFYTFLVQNGLWWIKQRQKDPEDYLDGLPLARNQILNGQFPDYIMRQFEDVLGHFGQAPIIVRSSSLLEDDFGSSFAGKAQSVLCPNRGTTDQRLEEFVAAVRRVYASNMSAESLNYRAARGLLGEDEQMAVLVQRVSGATHGHWHFPHLSGVGLSFNPYVWDKRIDPEAGVLRVVVGLGTRAVDPQPDDYTRVAALNEPGLELSEPNDKGIRETQQDMDLLDLDSGHVTSVRFTDLVQSKIDLPLPYISTQDRNLKRMARESGRGGICPWVVDLSGTFQNTDFAERMRALLATLSGAYGMPVDVEFAVNFDSDGQYWINLLQCRPFLTDGAGRLGVSVSEIPLDQCIIRSAGPIIGRSREVPIDRVVYVDPNTYGQLPIKDRYAVARLIGTLMQNERAGDNRTMLLGPGRWGTSTPSLGIPVTFPELKGAVVIGEIASMHEGLTPDLSLGSHFFHELVEIGILYISVFPNKTGHRIDADFFEKADNRLTQLMPEAESWTSVVKVVEPSDCNFRRRWHVIADSREQVALLRCWE
jgi:pyruvate, water dikinase